ncbi:MAG TPA: MFS transporter [Solirubrobacteraceae bacterium]|jgi:EmrB/QacA subfamily drug resistance transporter|nr:MFS transporter [Solirubrobacteraceae bacterium]
MAVEEEAAASGGARRSVMLLMAGALFMELLDGTIVATAAPRMAHSFGVQAPQVAVAITAYLVVLATLIPLSGWLADRYGSRTMFVIGVATFTLASGLCALTHSLAQLTALRALQGAGGATMVPVGRLVVLRGTDRAGIVRAVAFLTWPALVAPIAAPLVGGALTSYLSWRWIFIVNVPLGVVATVVAARIVPQLRAERREGLDWIGFVLTMLCLVAIIVCAAALGATRVRWVEVGVSAAVSIGAGVAGVRHLLGARAPLLDLRLFAIPTFRAANTAGTLNRLAINAVPFLLPLLFQVGFGWTPVKSGEVVLALFVGNLAIKPATTPILRRFGFRTMIVAANLVATATIVGCGLITASTPLVAVLALLVVSGAARSAGFTAYNTIAFADVEPQSMGDANTITWTGFQVSIAVGVALAAVGVRIGAWSASTLGAGSPTPAYRTAFLILALLTLAASAAALRMRREAGGELLATAA